MQGSSIWNVPFCFGFLFDVLAVCKIDELVKKFIGAPNEKLLNQCTKEQLTKIAEHFEVVEGDKKSKVLGYVVVQDPNEGKTQ